MDPDEDAGSSSLKAYYELLRNNRAFTVVWIGEVGSACWVLCPKPCNLPIGDNGDLTYGCLQIIDNIGNWLNYVATLSLVEELAEGKGLWISAVLIVRFLPSFLMFPIAGVVADRYTTSETLLAALAYGLASQCTVNQCLTCKPVSTGLTGRRSCL